MAEQNDSLRFQLPKKTQLSEETKSEIANVIIDDVAAMSDDRAEWQARWTEYLDQWDNYISPIRKGLWDESSNIHVPFTAQQILAHHARFMDLIFNIYPNFYLIPTDPADDKKKKSLEVLMQWELDRHANRNQGIQAETDRWLWDMCTLGRGVMKGSWCEEREKFVDVEDEMAETQAPDGSVIQTPTGNQIEVEKETVIYAGTNFKAIDPLDFYMPANTSIDEAAVLAERIYLSGDDLRRFKKFKHFYADAIDKVLSMEGDKLRYGDKERSEAQIRDDMEGVAFADAKANRPMYKIIEWYGKWDVNNDGYEERIVAWLDEKTKQLLGWNYLNRISKSSRPPYHVVDFIPRRGWPMGLVELLYSVNQEMDSMHNIRIDSGILANVPWGTIKESKTIKADDIMIKPGYFLPVSEHDDIKLLSGQSNMPFFVQEEGLLLRHGERLGIPDAGQGQTPSTIGPLATATGTVSLLNELNRRIGVYMMRVRSSWSNVLKHMYQLLKERMPIGTAWRVTGEDGKDLFGQLESREDFAANVDFHFVANTATLNKELDKQNSIIWLQTAMNPLMIQLGLSNPETIKNAAKDVARSLNKQGLDNYIANASMNPIPQTLEEEISFILQGISPIIVLNDDHEAKINGLITHRDSEELINYFQDPQVQQVVRMRFDDTIKKHMGMLQAIQAQAQSSNVSGIEVGPTMSNRVAGGPLNTQSPAGEPAPMGSGPVAGNPGITGGSEGSQE